MAVIRDVMPAFELFQPATIDDTMRVLGQYRADAWVMAGGLDTFDWLKDRIKRPKVVVDLSQIGELRGIRALDGGGLEIGATTSMLTEVVQTSCHPREVQHFVDRSGSGGLAADSQPGHARRKRFARYALLVLPRGMALLSRWREHLLRGYADGD